MPTSIMWAPAPWALSSAALRLARTCVSSSVNTGPASSRGGMLISTLNCASSVVKSESAIASSTAGVEQRRVARLVGQVELDLEPHRAPLGVEARLREHAREDVEARAHLLAVALAVLAAEDRGGDVFAHGL